MEINSLNTNNIPSNQNIGVNNNMVNNLNTGEINGPFTTLNENIIPDPKFLKEIQEYQPRLSEEIVRLIANENGMSTIDNRVYKLLSIVSQSFIEDIIMSTTSSIISKKNNNKFFENKELIEILREKGISINKSQYYCDNLNINLDTKQK